MSRYLSALVIASVVAVLSACAPAAPTVERAAGVAVELPACATEDSDDCVWDASIRGNGEGRSFTVRDGVVTYLSR